MKIYTTTQNDFTISTDRLKLNIAVVHDYLCNESYWAKNISIDTVKKSIEGSCCFGLYHHEQQTLPACRQVGFARVITDHATFGYLADVFILQPYRGKGLSKWLMQTIMNHPELQEFRRWMLATKDAHALYAKFGFKPLENPGRFMRYSTFDEYPAPIGN